MFGIYINVLQTLRRAYQLEYYEALPQLSLSPEQVSLVKQECYFTNNPGSELEVHFRTTTSIYLRKRGCNKFQ